VLLAVCLDPLWLLSHGVSFAGPPFKTFQVQTLIVFLPWSALLSLHAGLPDMAKVCNHSFFYFFRRQAAKGNAAFCPWPSALSLLIVEQHGLSCSLIHQQTAKFSGTDSPTMKFPPMKFPKIFERIETPSRLPTEQPTPKEGSQQTFGTYLKLYLARLEDALTDFCRIVYSYQRSDRFELRRYLHSWAIHKQNTVQFFLKISLYGSVSRPAATTLEIEQESEDTALLEGWRKKCSSISLEESNNSIPVPPLDAPWYRQWSAYVGVGAMVAVGCASSRSVHQRTLTL
jgi:hypothetical protein